MSEITLNVAVSGKSVEVTVIAELGPIGIDPAVLAAAAPPTQLTHSVAAALGFTIVTNRVGNVGPVFPEAGKVTAAAATLLTETGPH